MVLLPPPAAGFACQLQVCNVGDSRVLIGRTPGPPLREGEASLPVSVIRAILPPLPTRLHARVASLHTANAADFGSGEGGVEGGGGRDLSSAPLCSADGWWWASGPAGHCLFATKDHKPDLPATAPPPGGPLGTLSSGGIGRKVHHSWFSVEAGYNLLPIAVGKTRLTRLGPRAILRGGLGYAVGFFPV